MLVLGIESSCDETAAAVVEDGRTILSSVVASQVAVHHPYGGVVPELASRKHIEAIGPVVQQAISEAAISTADLNGVAVTQGPGLIGSLLVGFSFARAWAYANQLPCSGVNHLEGHIHSLFISPDPPPFPFVVLLVSGGHTCIYHVTSHTTMELMGSTRDDAAGEAFDKVAKMLGLGYPGGVVIDKMAQQGNPKAIPFPRVWLEKSQFDFSFSGIKTAVKRYIDSNTPDYLQQIPDIVASFQDAVTEVLTYKLIHAAQVKSCRHVAIAGGVAANTRLREQITLAAMESGLSVHLPPISLCGDNAAMIAAVGYHQLKSGNTLGLQADVYSRTRR